MNDLLNKPVRVRIAPSPSGYLHVGTARMAIANWLYARRTKGQFLIRIEDTDKERSKAEYEKNILDGLDWLGLEYDELYKQSTRGDVYSAYIENLLKENKAYVSKEPSKDD